MMPGVGFEEMILLVLVAIIVIGVYLIAQRDLTMGALLAASMLAGRALAPAGLTLGPFAAQARAQLGQQGCAECPGRGTLRPRQGAVERRADETSSLFAETWHSDWSFQPQPPAGTCLYGLVIPPIGGDTLFANQHAALDAMPHADAGWQGLTHEPAHLRLQKVAIFRPGAHALRMLAPQRKAHRRRSPGATRPEGHERGGVFILGDERLAGPVSQVTQIEAIHLPRPVKRLAADLKPAACRLGADRLVVVVVALVLHRVAALQVLGKDGVLGVARDRVE